MPSSKQDKVLEYFKAASVKTINQRVLDRYPKAYPADQKTAFRIGKLVDEIRVEAKRQLPTIPLAPVSDIYLNPSKSLNALYLPDVTGQSAIIVSTTMLNRMDDKQLKYVLAHEVSHGLLFAHENLRKNPALKIVSTEYKAELARLHFAPSKEELGKMMADVHRSNLSLGTKSDVAKMIVDGKTHMYREELLADKLGLILTQDKQAAHDALWTLGRADGEISANGKLRNLDKLNEDSFDPHPSIRVRMSELNMTDANANLQLLSQSIGQRTKVHSYVQP